MLTPLAADSAVTVHASHGRLIMAACVSIALIIVLITWLKLHPFLSLLVGSGALALLAGITLTDTFTAFSSGMGSTVGGVGVLIALGAIIGALLVETGAADEIVDTFLEHTSEHRLPWVMATLAFLIGIPLFFEVGLVLLIPVVMLVARRVHAPVVLLGIPALAGLSALHGLIPATPWPSYCHRFTIRQPWADLGPWVDRRHPDGHYLWPDFSAIHGEVGSCTAAGHVRHG